MSGGIESVGSCSRTQSCATTVSGAYSRSYSLEAHGDASQGIVVKHGAAVGFVAAQHTLLLCRIVAVRVECQPIW
jgi:hypothetical protein